MILILRGHIRNSFQDLKLYRLLKHIQQVVELELYICTWSVFSTSRSYRLIQDNSTPVTTEIIHAYFKDLVPCIKGLHIMNEDNVTMTGRTEGTVGEVAPIKGWKYMVANIFYFLDALHKSGHNPMSNILTTRFDILHLACNRVNPQYFMEFVQAHKDTYRPIVFTKVRIRPHCGCDNLMIGKLKFLHALFEKLHFCLDEVLERHPVQLHQEHYVMMEHAYLESLRKQR